MPLTIIPLVQLLGLTASAGYAFAYQHSPFTVQLQSRSRPGLDVSKAAFAGKAAGSNSSNVQLKDFFNGTDLQ